MNVFPTQRRFLLRVYALFNYDAASEKVTADPDSLLNCENAWHTAVRAKE